MQTMVGLATASGWVAPLRSILVGFVVFFLGSASDVWLWYQPRSLWVAIMDDALVGVGAGLLVLLYERRQRKSMIRKLETIRLMNHHVRNSLQVIAFAASVPKEEEHAKKIRDAVEQIEWALREVLPGQREDISDFSLNPSSQTSAHKPRINA
jgi:hypothetical protein